MRGMWDVSALRAVYFHKLYCKSHCSHLVLDAPCDCSGLGLVTTVFCVFAALSIVVEN